MKKEPIAIVGMSCRFPGGCNDPEAFWQFLQSGTSAVTEIDEERWATNYHYHPDRGAPGKTYSKAAGQIDKVFEFDPEFFGISPREAAQMDPQQRLLLELAWEALEDGGQVPERLAGSDCAVFVGISSTDYANYQFEDPSVGDGYFMTGNAMSVAANRISYFFDLRGPSMAIDTACSSSLVALHQACSSLWGGSSPAAIVGAVHLLLSPFPYIGFSKASMLSPRGRCRVFDADADGYVRSEGSGVLYLKPLGRAQADGDPIHALILGTAVNTDGRNSGLTIPNGAAQEALLTRAYQDAGIPMSEVDYIEAHGTGTPVGDPIEARAIGHTIGAERPRSRPILIGSVKSNIGHLEPASGIAGLFKVILALRHRGIPASINLERPNPNIDFDALNLRVVDRFTPMDSDPLIMGVNSFGFGGSNGHAILTGYRVPAATPERAVDVSRVPLLLSAGSQESLRRRARQFAALLSQRRSPRATYDILYTAAVRRQRLKHGLAVWGNDVAEITARLSEFADGETPPGAVTTERVAGGDRVAFVFAGNGSQWQGMGRELLRLPRFRECVERIDTLLRPLTGWSVAAELRAETSRLEFTEVAQPALFAVQMGLIELLREDGISAEAVIGHSVGEIAAACAAGALDLAQAVEVVYRRSEAQGRTKGRGRMAAARVSPDEVQELLSAHSEADIAAFNSPDSVTFAGPSAAIDAIARELQQRTQFCRVLDLDYAFHSRVMDDIRAPFEASLRNLEARDGAIEFYSTVTGDALPGSRLGASYWWDNIRQPVQLAASIRRLIERGFGVFVEVGPHPVLQTYLRECLRASGRNGETVAVMRRDSADQQTGVKAAVYRIYLSCGRLDPAALFRAPGAHAALPAYPWNHSEHRLDPANRLLDKTRRHPLLGFRLNKIEHAWLNEIDLLTHAVLADHVVDHTPVFPAAGFAEMALAASRACFERGQHEISNLEIRRPLLLDQTRSKEIQFTLSPEDLRFRIKSRERLSRQPWLLHASGRLVRSVSRNTRLPVDVPRTKANAREILDGDAVYAMASRLGLDYGPAFRRLDQVWVGELESLASIRADHADPSVSPYCLDPTLLDAALHALLPVLAGTAIGEGPDGAPFVPVMMENLRVFEDARAVRYCRCLVQRCSGNSITATFSLLDDDGRVVAHVSGCTFARLQRKSESRRMPSLYVYRQVPGHRVSRDGLSPVPELNGLAGMLESKLGGDPLVARELAFEEQVLPLYNALASALAERLLIQIGAHLETFTVESLLSASGIPPVHEQFLNYLLRMLEEDDKAVCRDGVWRLIPGDETEDAVAIWRSLIADHPGYLGELLHTTKRGFKLLELAALPEGPGPVSVDAGPGESAELHGEIVRQVLARIIRDWPRQRRRLRVGRIQPGESRVPRQLISLLPKEFCDLDVIVSDEGADAAELRQLAEYPHVRVTAIDFDKTAFEQQFREGEFDVLIVDNCLHRRDDILKAMTQLGHALAAGGLLLLVERRPDRLTDVNLGLDPDWWSRALDKERPVSRLMSSEEWLLALEKSGFVDSTLLSDAICRASRYYVLAATRPPRVKQVADAGETPDQDWLILADGSGECAKLAALIRDTVLAQGHRALTAGAGPGESDIVLNPAEKSDYLALFAHLDEREIALDNIVFLAGFDADGDVPGAGSVQSKRCVTVCRLLQALESLQLDSYPRLWLVTSAAQPGGPDAPITRPDQTALWGLGRVIKNEHPFLDCRMIDVQIRKNLHKACRAIVNEVQFADEEDEIILTDEVRNVVRLDQLDPAPARESPAPPPPAPPPGRAYRLSLSQPGRYENLIWTDIERPRPGRGEVQIRVLATGLNFRDLMYASGVLPEDMLSGGLAGATLGIECAGVVTETGEGVYECDAGDEVICYAPACFASHVIAPVATVLPKPRHWSFADAATVPTAFFTAYYALEHLAALRAGERVLIHGGAGGVGLAAIQVARRCGAEIFATAGTPEKRDYLRLLGVEHVFGSRDLEFADQILECTAGEGVDVILNSIAGEAVDKNLSLLRPFGRFLELGKRDYLENKNVGLRPFRHNISYFGIDADELLAKRPAMCGTLLNDMMELFERGELRPLVHTELPACDVDHAFRLMHHSRHVGKIVISMRDGPCEIRRPAPIRSEYRFRQNASYLITGGTSGFGLATARWMAGKGARHLILLARHGLASAEAQQSVARLRESGANVVVVNCDVADPVALQKVLRDLRETVPPLRGIVHAAMVLDDCIIRNLSEDSFQRVFRPKVNGAWNLHQLTLDASLDFFVMYSSVATYVGNPGQASYVASNASLEALARQRRQLGRPATAIAWDAITDTGFVARNPALRKSLARHGIDGITSAEALEHLEQILAGDVAEAAVIRANWQATRRLLPIAGTPKFTFVTHATTEEEAIGSDQDLRELIESLPSEEKHVFVRNLLAEEISGILQLPADRLEHKRSMQEMGVDSLMAMELVTALERRFGVEVPIMVLSENATIDALTVRVIQLLAADASESEEATDGTALVSSLARTHAEAVPEHTLTELAREADLAGARGSRLIR
jgi:acyl transferase domain-containing protein/acyl carrier protein